MGLLGTSYLVIINISAAVQTFNTNTFTAMDVWLYGCKLFIMGALFEYAFLIKMRQGIGSW